MTTAVILPFVGGKTRVAARHPDADLLAACVAYDALDREYFATDFEADADSLEAIAAEATRVRVAKQQEAYIDIIMDTRPMTPEGRAAQAHSLGLG